MDAINAGTAITAIVSLVGLVGGAFLATYKLGVKAGMAQQGVKIGSLEEKVRNLSERLDDNDEFTLNIATTIQARAELKAEADKMIDPSGASLRLTPFWKQKLEPIRPRLVEWYQAEGRYLPEWKLFWTFDKKFRPQIVKYVCKPYKLDDLQCLVAALLLVKESSGAFKPAGDGTPMPQKQATDTAIPTDLGTEAMK